MDQLNNISLEFTGNRNSGAQKFNIILNRNAGDKSNQSIKKKKDWYLDYFKNAAKVFQLRKRALDLAMEKVDKIIYAK